eukprot:31065-Pelagococcus_subviridis.AAC.6
MTERASVSCARTSFGEESISPTSDARIWSFSASAIEYGGGAPTTSGSLATQWFFARFLNVTAAAWRVCGSAASDASARRRRTPKPGCDAPWVRNASA